MALNTMHKHVKLPCRKQARCKLWSNFTSIKLKEFGKKYSLKIRKPIYLSYSEGKKQKTQKKQEREGNSKQHDSRSTQNKAQRSKNRQEKKLPTE